MFAWIFSLQMWKTLPLLEARVWKHLVTGLIECSTQDIQEQAEKCIEVTCALQRNELISWNFCHVFLSCIFLLHFVFLCIFSDEYEFFPQFFVFKDRCHLNFIAYTVRSSVSRLWVCACAYIYISASEYLIKKITLQNRLKNAESFGIFSDL